MIVVPYGHDQTVYGRQWLTWIVIVANVIAFALAYASQRGDDRRYDEAVDAIDVAVAQHPDARVRPEITASLPPRLRATLDFVTSVDTGDDPEGDYALKKAVKRFVAAIDERSSFRYGYRPGRPTVLGFLASPFMHADIEHLLGNMLFLWLVGAVVECFWEHLPFTILYIAAAAAGTLAHHLAAPHSLVPLVGASGAIAGLMGAFVVGHPKTKIKVFYLLVPVRPLMGTRAIPAWVLIPAWFALQLGFGLSSPQADGGVAYWTHVGGFVTGVVGALIMKFGGWVVYDAEQVLAKKLD